MTQMIGERDDALEAARDARAREDEATTTCQALRTSVDALRADISRQKKVAAKALKALARSRVECAIAAGRPPASSSSHEGPGPPSQLQLAPPPSDRASADGDGDGAADVNDVLGEIGSAVANHVLRGRVDILEENERTLIRLARDERRFRLLLERRQSAAQRSIFHLISLLFAEEPDRAKRKHLRTSMLIARGSGGGSGGSGGSGGNHTGGIARRKKPKAKGMARASARGRALETAGRGGRGEWEEEGEERGGPTAAQLARYGVVASVLEDELDLLDTHYDRLLRERDEHTGLDGQPSNAGASVGVGVGVGGVGGGRATQGLDLDARAYIQSLIDRLIEEMKEKNAQISLVRGVIKSHTQGQEGSIAPNTK